MYYVYWKILRSSAMIAWTSIRMCHCAVDVTRIKSEDHDQFWNESRMVYIYIYSLNVIILITIYTASSACTIGIALIYQALIIIGRAGARSQVSTAIYTIRVLRVV
jgi:hypothetical protein